MRHRKMRRISRDAEGGGVKHRKLAGIAEDQVEADRQDAEDEREDEDGQRNLVVEHERYGKQRQPKQLRPHRRPPNKPAGRSSRISTRNTRP